MIGEGDSFSFRTQAGATYAPKTKCIVTYKRNKATCPMMRFTCPEFNIFNKDSSCKKKDRMILSGKGRQKRFCQTSGPDVTTSDSIYKVSFFSDKKRQASGAVCTMQCTTGPTTTTTTTVVEPDTTTTTTDQDTTTTTEPTTTTGSEVQKWLPWFLGMEPMELCVEIGTEVIFNKTGHNVVQMATQADCDGCTGFLGENPTVGNNIDPFPWQAEMDGVYYFACGVGTHCSAGGMKAKITVAPSCAKNVSVPWSWGMEPQVLCVETGTTVIIEKTGSSHNVNILATQSDYDNCTGFTDTAGNSVNPYIFQADMQGTYYFACGVGTHCKSGNMKAMITVADSC